MLEFKGTIKIEGDRIIELEESENLIIDRNGKRTDFGAKAYAYPGFTDSHGHIYGLGMHKLEVNFRQARGIEECVEMLRHSKITKGDWLVGFAWNHENWSDKSMPNKSILDATFPNNPVFMLRADCHSALVNSAALKIAGIDSFAKDPLGGIIFKDNAGYPTGLLLDNAIPIVSKLIPDYSLEQKAMFIQYAMKELAKYGITEAHDMDVETELLPIYQSLDLQNKLPIRINSYVRAQNNEWLRESVAAYRGRNFSIVGLKYFIDGALGSRGAALLQPYEDDAEESGILLIEPQLLINRAKRGILSGFDIAMHAIGDRAVRFALDAVEVLRKDAILKGRGKFRIEHSQIIHSDDIERYSKLGVAASVQPVHFASDSCGMAQKRLGNTMKDAYLWKTLLENNVQIVAGSDFPVESPSVIEGIRAFLHRQPLNSDEPIFQQEKLSLNEALSAYCVSPHDALGDSSQKGSLAKGKYADIAVLSDSLKKLESDPKANIEVLSTFVGGEVIY